MVDHEKVDVYRVGMTFVAWAYRLYKKMSSAQMQVCEGIAYAYEYENENEYE